MPDYSLGTAEGKIKIGYDGKGITQARDDFGRLSSGGGSLASARQGFRQVGIASTVAFTAIAGGIALAVNSAIDFEAQISAIGAVSGASSEQLEVLRRKALQLGADTKFSASEAASAMEELVKAGLSVEDVMNGAADATVALAAAGGIDLPAAATIAANAMNQFNLAASDLPRIADLIAGAANASAIDVGEFGFAMSQAGAVAHLVGVSFDDLATAIALMGNAGIRGSDAGTSLKTMLQNLQPTTKKQIELMKKLGIVTKDGSNRFFDQTGSLKSLSDVAGILNGALAGMTDAQKAMALETIFGSDAIRAAAVLAGEGAAGFNEMATAMGQVTAQEVAAKRLDNVAGALEQLKGSVETAAIAFGTTLLPVIRKVAEFITLLVNKFSALDPRWQKLIAFAAVAAAALLGLIAVIAAVGAVIAGVAASLVAVKIAAVVAAIVIAIIALATAIKLAYDHSAQFRDLLSKLGQVAGAIFRTILAVVKPIAEFIRNTLIPTIKQIVQSLMKNLAPAFKAIGDFIKTHVLPGIQRLQEALTKAMPTIMALAKVGLFLAKILFEGLGKALGFIIPLLFKLIGPIFSLLIEGIATVIEFIPKLVSAFQTFIGVLTFIGKVIAVAVIAPLYLIYQAGKFVFEQLAKIVQGFVAEFMAVWNFLWPVTKAVWDLIVAIVRLAFTIIGAQFDAFRATVKAIWDLIWNYLIKPVVSAFNAVKNAIETAVAWIVAHLSAAWDAIRGIWAKLHGWIVTPIVNAFNAVRDWISGRMTEVRNKVKEIWDAVVAYFVSARDRLVSTINNFTQIVDRVRTIFTQMRDQAIAKATEMVNWLRGLPGQIVSAIGNLGGVLVNAGRSLINGFWDGMKAIWNNMIGWVEGKMSSLRNLWPFSPAKEGPFSGRGWVLYSGRALMEGFAQGIDQRALMVQQAAERAMAALARQLPTDHSATVGIAASGAGTAAAMFGGAAPVPATTTTTSNTEVNINVPLEDLRSIRDVQDLLDFIDRLRNDSRRGVEVSVT